MDINSDCINTPTSSQITRHSLIAETNVTLALIPTRTYRNDRLRSDLYKVKPFLYTISMLACVYEGTGISKKSRHTDIHAVPVSRETKR